MNTTQRYGRGAICIAILTLALASRAIAFNVLVDFNTYRIDVVDDAVNMTKRFAGADGVYLIPLNSRVLVDGRRTYPITDNDWRQIIRNVGGSLDCQIVVEDNPDGHGQYDWVKKILQGKRPTTAVCYNEDGAKASVVLTDAQIAANAKTHDGRLTFVTRSYNTSSLPDSDWRPQVDRALADSRTAGVLMETTDFFGNSGPDLIRAALAHNKRFYLLVSAARESKEIDQWIPRLIKEMPHEMADPRVTIVINNDYYQKLPKDDRTKLAATWYGPDDSVESCLKHALEYRRKSNEHLNPKDHPGST